MVPCYTIPSHTIIQEMVPRARLQADHEGGQGPVSLRGRASFTKRAISYVRN